ncbi:transmembrane protein -like [Brachionus plicatilis]|uniref:Transmembrane protein 192 n=1 Tax=Brachionus plicatilis TaxID=10195 RepID=A0A3M7S8Y2_BRAPC|nr:transmembrane protein -like [Brachionus plicatilis]
MVSLENTRNPKGGFSFDQIVNSNDDFAEQAQISFSNTNDNIPLSSELEPSFKQIKTTFLILAQIFLSVLFISSLFLVPFLCDKNSDLCPVFEPFDILLFVHAIFWIMFYVFDRVYHFHHMKSRRNGYLAFYRNTRLVRSLPLIVISAGNAIMVVLLRVFNKYCPESCTNSHLTALDFFQIFSSVEFGLIVLILVHYSILTLKFNKLRKMPDINQELERPFFSPSQIKDLGYKDKSYLSTILENQADMLRYLQEKNETLTQKLYQQNQKVLPNIN